MEHLLLTLGVPEDRFGSGEVGATSDVLRAYELLADHGALVIGAHVNSTHGVAMRNIRFGGQTKIAYTQDQHLHALEVTDLMSTSVRSTARFFNGTKAEYSRRMHCIQGSDAHRLKQDSVRPTNLGIGDRVTEFQLADRSFAALKACLQSVDWARVRPARSGSPQSIAVQAAREAGPSHEIAFYERVLGGPKTSISAIVRDGVAFANGTGGTIYLGVGPANRKTVPGIQDAESLRETLLASFSTDTEPAFAPAIDIISVEGKNIVTIAVAQGEERPYAVAGGEIPVRRGAETAPARRDEIIRLVRGESIAPVATPAPTEPVRASRSATRSRQTRSAKPARQLESGDRRAPRNGVEIVEVADEDGVAHYTMRDLRNDQITRNVTAATARSLWAQAIREFEKGAPSMDHITWNGDFGYWKSVRISSGERRYHLATRASDGHMRLFFGVSEEGLDDRWKSVIPANRSAGSTVEAPLPA
jgi:hypothetical protein